MAGVWCLGALDRAVAPAEPAETPAAVGFSRLVRLEMTGGAESVGAISAATLDFDNDGVLDLAVGYRTAEGGLVLLRAVDRRSHFDLPVSASALSPARTLPLDVAPEILLSGDFDGDGFMDLAAAARGATVMDVILGDGAGAFPRRAAIQLPGGVTAGAAADVNRADGLVDLLLAVDGPAGPALLVLESPGGALGAAPERIPLPVAATSIAPGRYLGSSMTDVAVSSGSDVVIVAGRDRRLGMPGDEAAAATTLRFSPAIEEPRVQRLVDPSSGGDRLALLGRNGRVSVLRLGSLPSAGPSRSWIRPFSSRLAVNDDATLPQESSYCAPDAASATGAEVMDTIQTGLGAGAADATTVVGTMAGASVLIADRSTSRLARFELSPSGLLTERWTSLPAGIDTALVVGMPIDADGMDDMVALDRNGGGTLALTAPTTAFVVNSTGDGSDVLTGDGVCNDGSGTCTLRAAIEEANALAGPDSVTFALGAGTPTISPAVSLPDVTGPLTIMGNTGGSTRIQINGAGTPASSNGITLAAGSSGSLVRSLVLNRFTGSGVGIKIQSANNTVEDCWIGLDTSGSITVAGNAGGGLLIRGASATGNTIGGTAASTRNVVSHNGGAGIIIDTGASGNAIKGNYIGTNPGATLALANATDGVAIAGGSPNNTIGGSPTSPGIAPGNVISGNTGDGVDLSGSGTTGTLVQGNLIGLNGAGAAALGNSQNGVIVQASAATNTIGGTTDTLRNVISGNSSATSDGVELNGTGVTAVNVFGNFIGLDVSGVNAVANGEDGVLVMGAPSNVIGAATTKTGKLGGNTISGNTRHGIRIESSGASGTLVQGNLVGLQASGITPRSNGQSGVSVASAPGTIIGGSLVTQRNVISANVSRGIEVSSPGTDNSAIRGNFIGTNLDGTSGMGNNGGGVLINGLSAVAPGIVIGGLTATPGAPPGNVISGNSVAGVEISGLNAQGILIQGNLVGLKADGSAALGNAAGIRFISSGGIGTTIGGTTVNARNVISGNSGSGVTFSSAGGGAIIQGNYIGTDPSGATAIGNGAGVTSDTGALTIGGSTSTPGTPPGNVISGNGGGIGFFGQSATGSTVAGNIIGASASGLYALPNMGAGISFGQRSGANTIGGNTPGMRNIISGNGSGTGVGSGIQADQCNTNAIKGNWIGVDITGTSPLPNRVGIVLTSLQGATPTSTLDIGGPNPGDGNVISGNLGAGVLSTHSGLGGGFTSGHLEGNIIGAAPDGVTPMGNGTYGVEFHSSSGIVVGGTTGLTPGSCTGSCNTIRFNALDGIAGTLTNMGAITVRGNRISDNTGLGIDFLPDGPTPNDAPDAGPQNAPVIVFLAYDSGSNTTTMQGTLTSVASTNFTIDVFSSPIPDPSGFGEGASYRGTTTCLSDGSGICTWSLVVSGTMPNAAATASATSRGTSEFSSAFADTDGDGYGNSIDNCVTVSNPDQIDDDFDGHGNACDCAPGDAGAFALPSEVSGPSFAANKTTLSWTSVAPGSGSGTVHQVLRGDAADLPVDGGPTEACEAAGAGSSVSVVGIPAAGHATWYAVRGKNACGAGTYGFATGGSERTSSACP